MKDTHKNMLTWMPIGMCLGVGVGCALGVALFDNVAVGMCLGLCGGMSLGMLFGSLRDKAINDQLREKGYTVQSVLYREESRKYDVTVTDKNGESVTVSVTPGVMKAEAFKEGDVVFLSDSGTLEQVYPEDERK